MATKMKKLGSYKSFDILEADTMFLFLPKKPPQKVIITSHGGHALLSKTNKFTVPSDTVLQFYSDDTFSVIDPGFDNFFKKVAAPKEIITEGEQCFDYILTKYQGRHGNKSETYESIANLMEEAQQSIESALGRAERSVTQGGKNAALTSAKAHTVPAVLTVRNRWGKPTVRLSIAIESIKAAAPTVQVFDCLFCRSTLFGGSQKVKLVRGY